jgi:hypothetical protein
MLALIAWTIATATAEPRRGPVPAADAGADAADPLAQVARRIRAALARDERLAGATIDVSVSGLLVTLRGSVLGDAQRDRAVSIARQNAEPYMMVYDGLRIVTRRSR